jgi:uncharacterized protein YqgC (DUF456 family)
MVTQPDTKNKMGNNILQLARWAGLAISIPFEMAAGPFIGYLIGSFLVHHFRMPKAVEVIFIVMGLIGSFINTAIIIKIIIHKEKLSSMK